MTARRLAYLGGSSYARPPLLLAVAWALVLPTRYWASGVPFWHNIPELDCHLPSGPLLKIHNWKTSVQTRPPGDAP